VFKLANDTGITNADITFIFDSLGGTSSVANRKKIIFSQVVNGVENPLFCELDSWDAVAEEAFFWVKPIKLSSTYSNIFYMYFDSSHDDNIEYLSETNEVGLSLFRNTGVEGTYDTSHILSGCVIKVGDKYQMWPCGHNGSKWGLLYCESTDLVTWTNHRLAFGWDHTYDTQNHHPGTVLYEDGLYKMWYSGSDGTTWRIMYCESTDGISWTNHQLVVSTGKTYYSDKYTIKSAVLKQGNTYKMWYGGYKNSPYEGYIIYCDSTDGINWEGHQMVIHNNDIPEIGYTEIRTSTVTYEEGKYKLLFEIYNSSLTRWLGYYADSIDGIHWENYSRWININTLGVYDTVSAGIFPYFIVKDGFYHFFYGVSNGTWRIATAKSVSLKAARTASQEVWDGFLSVHHFNSSYGYVDSTANRLNIVSTNNTTPVTSNLGSSAIELTSSSSYINFGGSRYYDNITTDMMFFAKFDSGRRIIDKGEPYYKCIQMYYTEDEIMWQESVDDTFEGNDGDLANEKLWTISGVFSIYDNKLRAVDTPSSVYSIYYFKGDFDIQVEFSLDSMPSIESWSIGILMRLPNNGLTQLSYRYSGGGYKYNYDTYNGSSWTGRGSYSTTITEGKLRMVRSGDSFIAYRWNGTGWSQLGSYTFSTSDTIPFYLTKGGWNNNPNFTASFFNFKVNSGEVVWPDNSRTTNSINLEMVDSSNQHILTIPNKHLDTSWSYYSVYKGYDVGANSALKVNEDITIYAEINDLVNTSQDLLLGSSSDSVLGTVAEVWFSNSEFSRDTLTFIDKMQRDNILIVSDCYVQGYATAYGKAQATKVLAYDKETKLLVGYADTDPETGYYYIEVPSQNECYLIGLDGGLYNHFILGKIFPYKV
jgi:hypothetical protein